MYKGFNFKLSDSQKNFLIANYYTVGLALYNRTKNATEKNLYEHLGPDGCLDCTKIQEDWFPNLKGNHVFLSHSHDDENLAISLAGYLNSKFGLITFIDSCVWSYANDLLREIDEEYCYNSSTKTFSYEDRNFSTAHVHMMLSTALQKMIDTTECVIFLNTSNSITHTKTTEDLIKEQTSSAWIYGEIMATKFLRTNSLIRSKIEKKYALDVAINEAFKKQFKPKYDADLKHLLELRFDDFQFISKYTSNDPESALDKIYRLKLTGDI